MRRGRAALAVFITMLLSLVVAGPASAGGPTSVLLVLPGTGQTASLYHVDTDYAALAGLVGAVDGSGSGTVDGSGASHNQGQAVTLTWLAHDVHVWRVDRIYFDAAGGPWISTQTGTGESSGSVLDTAAVWHRPERGKELAALLDRLGVSPDSATGGGVAAGGTGERVDPGTGIAASAAAVDQAQGTARKDDTGTPWTSALIWGLAGLTLGVTLTLTLAGIRLFAHRRTAPGELATPKPAEDGPADTHTSPPEPDSELDWALADELSSPARRK